MRGPMHTAQPIESHIPATQPESYPEAASSMAVLCFRVVALGLAAGFWCYYVGRKPFDATAGWRYLTNWGLSLNMLAALWALAGTWIRPLSRANPLLPAALTLSSTVVILYWGLYLISPSLVNANGGLPWYSEFYMHLGTTLFVYTEAWWLNAAPKRRTIALAPVALLGAGYILWVELVVSVVNDAPCGLHQPVCGYPYPFLNDFGAGTRHLFFGLAVLGFVSLSTVILTLWQRIARTAES